MKLAPFVVHGINQQSLPMSMGYHLVPYTHVLFFGPAECARHTFPGLVDDARASLLVVDDVRTSLGETEDLIREAVNEIVHMHPDTSAFVLSTACQTPFLGIDLENLCMNLHGETGLYFAHVEANRMSPDNIPGSKRKVVPGGDRYHIRRALVRMLSQASLHDDAPRGIAVLSDEPLDSDNELFALLDLPGIAWVRSLGDCSTFEEFVEFRQAIATIAVAPAWAEPQVWLEENLGIPGIYASTSYSLEEIDGYYAALVELLRSSGIAVPEDGEVGRALRAARERASGELDRLREELSHTYLDLDVRVIGRPFSLVETLYGYGFHVRSFQPSYECVQHKERDDIPAYERLCKLIPGLDRRFAAKERISEQGGPRSTKRAKRPGRFIPRKMPTFVEHVPEEVSWWGYASIRKLVDEFRKGMRGGHDTRERWML